MKILPRIRRYLDIPNGIVKSLKSKFVCTRVILSQSLTSRDRRRSVSRGLFVPLHSTSLYIFKPLLISPSHPSTPHSSSSSPASLLSSSSATSLHHRLSSILLSVTFSTCSSSSVRKTQTNQVEARVLHPHSVMPRRFAGVGAEPNREAGTDWVSYHHLHFV